MSPENELHLIEVKSVTSFEYLHIRLTPSQKSRLKRCVLWCLEKNPSTRLELAVVSQQGEVLVFQDIFG
jgi:Holliday junction resolvase-like predicted endonuclease